MTDDLLQLPFFTDEDRAFAQDLEARAAAHSWPDPEASDDEQALREALTTLAGWGVLRHTVARPWRMIPNVLAREILARHSGIADLAYVMQILGSMPVQLAGSDLLKSELLPRVERGEACMAFALSEPEAGSDVASLTTKAEPKGDGYLLTGTKHLISNAGVADFYTVFARTGENRKDISAFVVPADATEIRVRKQIPIAPHPLGEVRFWRVELTQAARLGEEGRGLKIALQTLERCRPTVGAAACGFAQRSLQEAVGHVQSRSMFGTTLAEMPLARAMLAEMRTRLDQARLLVYRAAWKFDQGAPRITLEAAQAKWQATEHAQWIIDHAMQLAGGLGVTKGSVFERLYREIRPLRIYEGASEVQQLVIASELLGA